MQANWNYVVLASGLLMLVLFLWKEVVRVNKSHLLLRIIAVTAAVASIACIVLPLCYHTNQQINGNHQGILITRGFNKDSLNKYQDLPRFTTEEVINRSYPTASYIHSLSELRFQTPKISQLHILGYGLTESELKQLSAMPVVFFSTATPNGVVAVNWDQQIKTGEELKVQGQFHNQSATPCKLVLKGLNVDLDSMTIKSNGNTDFQLLTIPKAPGKQIYHLIVINGRDTLENENIPVQIKTVKPLRVLILSSSPDFENRFLKNWLTTNNYAVSTRSVITKNKFSTEAVNAVKTSLEHLSGSSLQNFDVVLGDVAALQGLDAAEAAAIKQQVQQNGLGLIIRADSTGKATAWFQSRFPVNRISAKTQTATALVLKRKSQHTVKLNLDPVNIVYKQGTQVLVTDEQNKTLVSTAIEGYGKLVYTTINNSYNWVLAGNRNDYGAYWSLLIDKAARKLPPTKSVRFENDMVTVNQETNMLVASSSAPDSLNINGLKPKFIQSPDIPFYWYSKSWPEKVGWQSVTQGNKTSGDYYVFGPNDWINVQNQRKIFVTTAYAQKNSLNWGTEKQKVVATDKPIPKLWFYLLFIMATTFLWAEPKFSTL